MRTLYFAPMRYHAMNWRRAFWLAWACVVLVPHLAGASGVVSARAPRVLRSDLSLGGIALTTVHAAHHSAFIARTTSRHVDTTDADSESAERRAISLPLSLLRPSQRAPLLDAADLGSHRPSGSCRSMAMALSAAPRPPPTPRPL